MDLEWPDSEDLLQAIVNTDWTSLALPPASSINDPVSRALPQQSTSLHNMAMQQQQQPSDGATGLEAHQLSPVGSSREVIQSLSNMVTNLVRAAR